MVSVVSFTPSSTVSVVSFTPSSTVSVVSLEMFVLSSVVVSSIPPSGESLVSPAPSSTSPVVSLSSSVVSLVSSRESVVSLNSPSVVSFTRSTAAVSFRLSAGVSSVPVEFPVVFSPGSSRLSSVVAPASSTPSNWLSLSTRVSAEIPPDAVSSGPVSSRVAGASETLVWEVAPAGPRAPAGIATQTNKIRSIATDTLRPIICSYRTVGS